MFVIKLPNGNLMAPESAIDADGGVVGDAYVEVLPTDPEYARLAQEAVTEAELEDRQRRWRDGDEALRREFEMYLTKQGRSGPDGTATVVGKLSTGAITVAQTTIQNGYRELATNRWASSQFLKPVSGSC